MKKLSQNFDTLISHLPGIVYRCKNDRAWTMEFISQGIETISGYTVEDVLGNASVSFETLIHPEDRTYVRATIQEAIEERRSYDLEYRIVAKSGGIHFVWEQGSASFSESGEVLFLQGFIRDITARKESTDLLQKSESRVRSLFEMAAVGIAEVSPEGRWIRVNQQLCTIAGYTEEELLKLTFQDITHPEDLAADLENMQKLLAGKGTSYSLEKRYIRKDRSNVWIRLTVSLVRNSDDTPSHFISVVEDISVRKHAEEALRKSRIQLQLVTDHAPIGIAHCGADERYRFVNIAYASKFGLHPSDIVGKHPQEVLGEEAYAVAHPNIAAVLDGHRVEYDLSLTENPEGTRIFHVSYAPEYNENGQVEGFIAAILDITELKQVEDTLRKNTALLDSVIDQSAFPMWIADLEGTIIRVNRALCSALNADAEDVVGKYNILKDKNLQHEDMLAKVKRVFDNQEPVHVSMLWKAESSGATGLALVQDIYVDASIIPVFNEHGTLSNVLCQWQDITAQKKAETDLRESEERFRSTINDLQVAVVLHAPDTSIILCNPAAAHMLGVDAEEAIGKVNTDPVWNFVREDTSELPVEEFPVNQVLAARRIISNKIFGIKRSDREEPIWCETIAVPIFDENNQIKRIIVNFMNISELKQIERNLMGQNNELERFNRLAVGRELRMIELKKEINALSRELGRKEPYATN